MTEAAFTAQVLALARIAGWRSAHFRPARTASGWRRIVAAELKVGRNRPTPEQAAWLAALAAAGVDAHVWRPDDWPEIEATLIAP